MRGIPQNSQSKGRGATGSLEEEGEMDPQLSTGWSGDAAFAFRVHGALNGYRPYIGQGAQVVLDLQHFI